MECSRIREYLSDYLDDGLDAETRQIVDGHVRECPKCRRDLAALQATIRELRDLPRVAAPPDFLERIHERLDAHSPLKRLGRALFYPFRIKVPLQLAGAAAMAVLVFSLVGIQRTERPSLEVARPPAERTVKPPKEEPVPALRKEKEEKPVPAPSKERTPQRDALDTDAVAVQKAEPVRRIELALRIVPRPGADEEARPSAVVAESPRPQGEIRGRAAPAPAAGGRAESAAESRQGLAASAKKGAPAQEERPAERPDFRRAARDQIRELAERLGGRMTEFQEKDVSGKGGAVLVTLPLDRYGELLEGLRRLGTVEVPPPPARVSWPEERAEVVIRLLGEESKR
jgi:hypothetical protein